MTPITVNNVNKTAVELHPSTKAVSREFFDTEHLKVDLKERSVRGGAVTMTAQVTKFVLRTGSTMILARLLTPQDYGLIAMVIAITGFVELFKDMGLSLATIQKAEINHAQVSTLFWINVAVSIMLALVLAAVAPIISWFYNEPRLTYITLALAGTFIFSGLTVQHQALLRRQMRFFTLAVIEIGALIVGIITGITLAWYGNGYWALVGFSVAMALSNAVLVWIFCRWRPSLPVRQAGVRSMVAFGGHLTGFSIIGYFARNFDSILLGRFYGAGVLGLYSRAYSIMMLPISQVREPLNAVALPVLSHIQNETVRYRRYYIKLVTLLAFITMPLMVFLFVCADQVMHLLLGSQWSGATGIFKVLCITAFIQPVATTWGLVLVSLGKSKRYFVLGTVNSVIIIISFIIGLPWGAIGVAVAYTIANYALLAPTLWYCFRQTPVSIMDFFSAISRPVVASLCMGGAIFSTCLLLANQPDIVVVGACFAIGLLGYLLVLALIPGGYQIVCEFFSYASLLSRKET
jgi:O-antigen/teichoic acid export membrane protein